MAKILGIIGGGQLGMMLAEAARRLPGEISEVIVLDPTENCPAAQAGARQIIADFKDEGAIKELASKSDIITYEIESGNSDVLKSVQKDAEVNPSPETLKIIQDKFLQKSFLRENGIPVEEFAAIDSLSDLEEKIKDYRFPALLKARRDAYDGRGNYKIDSSNAVRPAFEYFQNKPVFLEKFVNFKMEVSVIAARNTHGDIKTYPLVENIHEDNILRMTIAPARVDEGIARKAEKIAHDTMKFLKGAGVFGIEMFVTQDDDVLINEIAPRVHNSGHHTLQSSDTSQFEQHLRAILGLELGSTALRHPSIMYNILGPKEFTGRYKPVTLSEENTHLKMYGKKISKPKRKLGHFNLIGKGGGRDIQELVAKIDTLKEKIRLEPQDSGT